MKVLAIIIAAILLTALVILSPKQEIVDYHPDQIECQGELIFHDFGDAYGDDLGYFECMEE